MAKKLHRIQPELTLTELSIQLMSPKHLKYNPQMLTMRFLVRRVHQHIINEDNHELIQIRPEYSVHQIHEHSWSIRQTKRHHQKFIMSISGLESYLGYVLFLNPQLVIPRPEINLQK